MEREREVSDRAELLARADELAQSAKRTASARNYSTNTPGNVAAHREAVVEELEAVRLTLIALLGPFADAVDLGIALAAEYVHD